MGPAGPGRVPESRPGMGRLTTVLGLSFPGVERTGLRPLQHRGQLPPASGLCPLRAPPPRAQAPAQLEA